MRALRSSVLVLVLAVALVIPATGQDGVSIRVAGWNLESGESNPALLRRQLGTKQGIDIWGLSEVQPDSIEEFERGAEEGENADFDVILGTTAFEDRLAIIYDTTRFEQVGNEEELTFIQLRPGLRAPLVARFRGRQTGQEFFFMVNHLKRGGAQNVDRIQQARLLNQWARQQTLPVIAVGDYNFDYDVERGDAGVPFRDRGFDEMTQDGVFVWVRPQRLFKTNADEDFNTVLDFIFVANPPFGWSGQARILERDGDTVASTNEFTDSNDESDHRPVDAIFELGERVEPGNETGRLTTLEDVMRRIEAMEAELRQLREALQRIANER
jgi:endonuclease/exonuclease/phosphatase family metal-dependent hydrolase